MKSLRFDRLRLLAELFRSKDLSRRTRAKNQRRILKLESLEERRLLVGDITGTVWNDANANGINETVENGIPGWTVFVDNNADGLLNAGEPSAVTDVNGKYAIIGVPAGNAVVYEIPQPGFSPTPGFTDHQTARVRDAREVHISFPNVPAAPTTGNIVGTVFEDDNENGAKDPGEHGLEGWVLYIDQNSDGSLTAGEPTAGTNADGDYRFTGITAGAATVVEIPEGGLVPIVGGLFPTTVASAQHTVTVVAGSSVRSDYANLTPPVGNIQGTVWSDTNGDGLQEAGESPLAGRSLFIDLNANGVQDGAEPGRVSDVNGAYSFNGIHTGAYRVVNVQPAGWISADNRAASVDVSVFAGSSLLVDFYSLVPTTGSVSGVLFNDFDGNGVQSVTETTLEGWQVYVDQNVNGIHDASEPTVTTGADGVYSFAGLAYGNVTIREVLPTNWVATSPASAVTTLHLLNGENRTGVNFGSRERIGSIQGNVLNDANGDRIRGASELGLVDWTVFLDLNSDGIQDPSEPATLTSATGDYSFSRVPVGTYRVVEVLPSGWIVSEGSTSVATANVVIGGTAVANFFNLVPTTGSVTGTVWNDADSNNVQGLTEVGLEGWQVYVDINANGVFDTDEPIATTDATGVYSITNVPYGTSTIREVVQPGYTPTNHPGGLFRTLILNGENRTGLDFGNREPIDFIISGTVFNDANKNGVRDAGELGLSGITVYLDANDNGTLDAGEQSMKSSVDLFYTPSVNELGNYSFTHLPRGTYHVREIVPVQLEATPLAARAQTVSVGPLHQLNVNFADVYRANEIHGVIYDDTNANHVRDAQEYARPGVPVYIDSNRNNTYEEGEPRTVTGDDGSYAFLDLTPGAYVVREDNTGIGQHSYPQTGGGILWPTGVSHPAVGNVTPTSITTSLANGEVYNQTISLTLPGSGGLTNLVDVFLLFDDTGSFTANSPIVRSAFPTIINTLQTSLPSLDLGFGVGRFEEYGSFAGEVATGRPFILNQPIVASSTAGFSTSIQGALDRMAPGFGGDGPETDIEALYQLVTGAGFDGNNNGSVLDSGAAGLVSTQLTPGVSGDVPSFDSFTADATTGVLPAAGNVGGGGFRTGALPIVLLATDIGFAYQPKGETSVVGSGGLTLPLSSLTQVSRATTPFSSGAGIQETVTGLNALGALVIGLGTNPIATQDPRQGLESLSKLTGAVNRSTATIANGTADPIAPGDPMYFQISSGFGSTVADGVVNAIQNAVTNVAMDITVRASDPRVHIINHTGTLLGVGAGQTASFDIEFVGDGRPRRFDFEFVRAGTNVVLGSIPVVLGTPVVGDGYSYDELDDGEIHQSSHFGNYVANVAPTFVSGTDQTVLEDAGSQVVAVWASSISAGPVTEAAQSLNFIVSNDNPSLFSTQPSIAADGTLTFTPAPNASGTAIVTVALHDNGGVGLSGADTSATQTFRISVTAVNDAPVAANDTYAAAAGTKLTVAASGVLANDTDAEGTTLTATLDVGPTHGTVTLNADGSFEYIPTAGYDGADSFTYTVSDGSLSSNVATVNITLSLVNRAPVATNDSYATAEDTALNVVLPGVLNNDTDSDGNTLTVTKVSGPAHGTLTVNANGSFLYTPAANFNGVDSFTYTANDGTVDSNIATVTINVSAVNDAPTATDDSYAATEGSPLNILLSGVLSNDTDVDGDALTATVVTGPTNGTVTLNADGSFTYTPASGFSGADSFTYTANDGSADSNVATVSIAVARINHAPVANDDAFSVSEDLRLVRVAPGVLTNDTDSDGDALTVTLISGPTHGVLTLNANGSFDYLPTANYNGLDTFTYKTNDGLLDSNVSTVTLTINAVNDAPVATNELYLASEDVTLNVALPGVLANDTDVDGNPLSAVLVAGPTHGTLVLNANGSFSYTPAANYNGPDSFVYKANDGLADSNQATVTITIAAVNDAPVAVADSYSTSEDTPLSVTLPGLLGNDSDIDSVVLQAVRVTNPAHGTLTLSANGTFLYTPAANFNGVDSFTYVTSDGLLSSTPATVTINIAAVNDAPTAGSDTFNANQDTALVIAPRGVLVNDTDVDGDVLSAVLATGPAHGTVALNADGSFTYTSVAGYSGVDSFTYRASDATTTSGLATVSIAIAPFVTPTKFFVVDADRATTFQYAADGSSLKNAALNKSDSKPRGIASNSTGTTQWVIDTSGTIFVYDNANTLLGSWQPQGVGKPEGITVWGNDLWLVDPTADKVFKFTGGAAIRTGRVNATSNFALNSGNLNATDIVTDGSHLWVVNDTLAADKVFRYSTSGVLEGNWNLSTTNPSPTGITLDPTNVNHLWVIDASTDKVYQYNGATARLTGSQEPAVTFVLAATNTNPQGIADPMPAPAAKPLSRDTVDRLMASLSDDTNHVEDHHGHDELGLDDSVLAAGLTGLSSGKSDVHALDRVFDELTEASSSRGSKRTGTSIAWERRGGPH